MTYDGIDPKLKAAMLERDSNRCRWCGATNRGTDAHHIRYRRGAVDDVLDNLITLCRAHHGFVHGIKAPNGDSIVKSVAQDILRWLVEHPGTTGMQRWRALKREWVLTGRCVPHGLPLDECLDCGDFRRPASMPANGACEECGNDDPAEGYRYCTDCMEQLEELRTRPR